MHPAVSVLRRVWARHFERAQDPTEGARLRPVQGRGPGDRVESPYDADARFRAKSSTRWTGYMVHLTESCDAEAPRLVLHADATPANVHEAARIGSIHAALAAKGLPPAEHLVDAAYVSADHLIAARELHGIDLVGPGRRNLSWQTTAEGAFSLADFAVDWERKVARCPEGKESIGWAAHIKHPVNAKHSPRDALWLRCLNASCGLCNHYRSECYAVVVSETASRLEMSCSTPGLVRR